MIRRLLRLFVSARATVLLICALAVLLLLNVVLPQAEVLGEERFAELVEDRAAARFVLVDLGLGRMATSPVFLAVLGLFFLNLITVLATRVGPTWRRLSPPERAERGLRAWARLEENLAAPLPEGWSAGHAARTLRGFGYQVRRPGEKTFWGVKHRTAPLGFLLFHVSFLLLCAGGVAVYYTRFVGAALLSEGQEFTGSYSQIERHPPLGGVPELRFSLERVETRFEHGEPLHLGAVFRMQRGGSRIERRSRINHPARWGAARLLVNQAGLAPVLWLQDSRGFTLDRIVAPVRTRGRQPTNIRLGGGDLVVLVHPLERGVPFPSREQLPDTAMRVQVTDESRLVYDGKLKPGDAAELEHTRLVLEEYRLWVRVRVISERGPGLLVTGFAVGVVGLIWRLLLYRREVAMTWDGEEFRLVGRAEYFSWRFKKELEAIRAELAGTPGARKPVDRSRGMQA